MSNPVRYSDLIDPAFVFELSKRGRVHLCTSQIIVYCDESGIDLDGIVIPPNTFLQWMVASPGKYDSNATAQLTFKVMTPEDRAEELRKFADARKE
jgi:hypothetical protein